MTYFFGQSFTRTLYPTENNQPFQVPTQTPTIYIFNDEPSRLAGSAGTGAIQTVVSWSQAATTPFGCSYTVPAIDDPYPTADTLTDADMEYWEAINFVTQTGGQVQTLLRSFMLERPTGAPELPGTTAADLKEYFPWASEYFSDAQLNSHIAQAELEVKIELRGKGYEWSSVHNLADTKLLIGYRTLEIASSMASRKVDDAHAQRGAWFAKRFEALSKAIKLQVDTTGDGAADTEARMSRDYVLVTR